MAPVDSPFEVVAPRGLDAFGYRDADRAVVRTRGGHDVSTVAALSATMAGAIALGDAQRVVGSSRVLLMDVATVRAMLRRLRLPTTAIAVFDAPMAVDPALGVNRSSH